MAAFTTKSNIQHGSPFTPPGHRTKTASGFYRPRGMTATLGSDVVLSTVNSIHHDVDLEHELAETDEASAVNAASVSNRNLHHKRSVKTFPDLERGEENRSESPVPPYHAGIELGFKAARCPSIDESDLGRIRVDVETTTSTI